MPVRTSVEVPASNVRLVPTVMLTAKAPDNVIVLARSSIVLAVLVAEKIRPAVTENPAVSNVPVETVTSRVPTLSASPRVTVPPAAFTVTPPNVLPAVVSVAGAEIVTVPVWV